MYSVRIRNIENSAVPMMKPATFAAASVCSRKIENGTSGSRCRSSQTTKAARRAAEATKTPIVVAESPPPLWPCVIPSTSRTRPEVTNTAPGTSWLCPCASLLSREQDRREDEPGDADRDVHEEDPLPGEEIREDAAQEDAGRSAEAADRAPGAERDVALAPLGEGGGEDGERGRRDGGRAETLERPGGDQRLVAPGEAAEKRADRKDDEPAHEDDSASEDVRESATEQHEAAEDERVGADDPLQVVLREAEVDLDRGQRDVYDRDVEDDHELDGANKRQCVPFRAVGRNHAEAPSFSFPEVEVAILQQLLSFCKLRLPFSKNTLYNRKP